MSKHVNKFITLKVQLIFSALLSFYSMATLAVQNTELETNINRSSIQSTPWKLWQEDNFFNVSYRVDNSTNLIEIRAQAKFESTLAGFLYFIEDLQITYPQMLADEYGHVAIDYIQIWQELLLVGFSKMLPERRISIPTQEKLKKYPEFYPPKGLKWIMCQMHACVLAKCNKDDNADCI